MSPLAPHGAIPAGLVDYVDYDDFFRVEFPRTVRYLRRAGAAFEEAEDAAQEAMRELWSAWPTRNHPVGWVRVVALHAYLKKAERDRKRVALEAKNACLATPAHQPRAEPDEWADMVRTLRQLPLRQREVLALALDGYGTDEIAALLGMRPGTVRSNLRHARDALKAFLVSSAEGPAPGGPVPPPRQREGGPHVQQG